jgi:hypothetical protein
LIYEIRDLSIHVQEFGAVEEYEAEIGEGFVLRAGG